ncbi:RNA binding protein [Dorcoceras hygrometricum]|uniref:RNA binding protein n=1 Tax=Dorcoceras hygrometricum TaxID=472368 RepID=A0A2Z7C9H9_9LAMI|nr:RNA binding protein [Dorcoceras hygrometricum]
MGCPGQARTRPERNQPSQRYRRRRRTAAAGAIKSCAVVTCAAQPRNAMRDQRSFLALCPTMCATNCAWNGRKSQAIVRPARDKKLAIPRPSSSKKFFVSI